MAPNLRNKRCNSVVSEPEPVKKTRMAKNSSNSSPEAAKRVRSRPKSIHFDETSNVKRAPKSATSTSNTTLAIQDTTVFNNGIPAEMDFTPEILAHKLEDFCNNIAQLKDQVDCPDLKDFDMEHDIENLEKYQELREELRKKMKNFDEEGKTEVNFDTAAIAGAKLLLDEKKATRSVAKKLAEEVGTNENNLLYHGLERFQDKLAAQEVLQQRTSSIIESFVDLQKQIKFKMNVLNYVAKKASIDQAQSKSHPRTRQQIKEAESPKKPEKQKAKKIAVPKTPKKMRVIDPLAHSKIIDEYALEVASEVVDHSRKPRKIAPIPIDFTILDEKMEVEEN